MMKSKKLKKYSTKTEPQTDKGVLKMCETLCSKRDIRYYLDICGNSDGFRQINLCRGSIFL